MKKLLFAIALMACTLFMTTVFASGEEFACEIDLATGEMSISGNTGTAATYTLLVLNPGYTTETAASDNTHRGVQFQYEGQSDGVFSVRVPLNTDLIGETSGEMQVYCSYAGLAAPLHTTVYYGSADEVNDAVTAFIGIGQMENTSDIVAVLDSVSKPLAFDTKLYQASNKTELAERVKAYVKETQLKEGDGAKIQAEVKALTLLTVYHQGKSELLIGNDRLLYADMLGLTAMDSANNVTAYSLYLSDINATGITNVNKSLIGNKYASLAELQKAFASAVVVEGVRNNVKSGSGHVGEILRNNAGYVGLNLNKYTDTTAKNTQIKSANAATIPELQAVIDRALPNTTGGGTGGGGGGSSSSSGRGMNAVNLPQTSGDDLLTSEIERNVYELADMGDYSWAAEAVEALMKKSVISIPPDKMYRPGDNITREEAVKLLVAAFEIDMAAENTGFTDVSETDWSAKYIYAAKNAGIVTGVSEDVFDKKSFISREDMAVMMKRCLDYKKKELSATQEEISFTDQEQIAEYAKDAVAYLTAAGVINGMGEGTFSPKGSCTRAQCAVLLYRLINS